MHLNIRKSLQLWTIKIYLSEMKMLLEGSCGEEGLLSLAEQNPRHFWRPGIPIKYSSPVWKTLEWIYLGQPARGVLCSVRQSWVYILVPLSLHLGKVIQTFLVMFFSTLGISHTRLTKVWGRLHRMMEVKPSIPSHVCKWWPLYKLFPSSICLLSSFLSSLLFFPFFPFVVCVPYLPYLSWF